MKFSRVSSDFSLPFPGLSEFKYPWASAILLHTALASVLTEYSSFLSAAGAGKLQAELVSPVALFDYNTDYHYYVFINL